MPRSIMGLLAGAWMAAGCGAATREPPAEAPATLAPVARDEATPPQVTATNATTPASETPAIPGPEAVRCDRRCAGVPSNCLYWGGRDCAPPASCGPPAEHRCAEVCCGPDRLSLIDPAEVTLEFLGRAAEGSTASLVMTHLGGAGIGPECPVRGSEAWTPERGTAREVGSCPGGRVTVGGIEADLSVVVTRWVARPADAYGVVTLTPTAATPPIEWLARMRALLVAGYINPDPIDDTPPSGYPVFSNVYAFIHEDGPRITFGHLSRGGLRR